MWLAGEILGVTIRSACGGSQVRVIEVAHDLPRKPSHILLGLFGLLGVTVLLVVDDDANSLMQFRVRFSTIPVTEVAVAVRHRLLLAESALAILLGA